ncbi:SRP54 domain-containing protein [Balamuthia mandrillaris]
MLDHFAILSKGGLVLWSHTYKALQGEPVNDLVKTVLLEDRNAAERSFSTGNYTVQWTLHNDFELIFVVVYHKLLQLLYIEELLQLVKDRFCSTFGEALKENQVPRLEKENGDALFAFTKDFERLKQQCEQKAAEMKQKKVVQRTFEQTTRGQEKKKRDDHQNGKQGKKKKKKGGKKDNEKETNDVEEEGQQSPEQDEEGSTSPPSEDLSTEDIIQQNREKLLRGKLAGRARGRGGPRGKAAAAAGPTRASAPSAPPKKKKQVWEDGDETYKEFLRKSKKEKGKEEDDLEVIRSNFGADQKINLEEWEPFFQDKPGNQEDDEEENSSSSSSGGGWGLGSIFSGLTNRTLSRKDLEPVLAKFREKLIDKNVASEIADELCESVMLSLEGKTMSSFKRIQTTVKTSLEASLTRILTPKRTIDVLREIAKVRKEQNRPYSIVFVGVNGVGKSTNLAKVCSYLLQNGQKTMITACDTFRSGAVEQLKVHARNLDVPLFERGYEKDAALVAESGIADARQRGMDVVLIDTAGRMQDKRPLMQALAKLVYQNNPDLILFVGEALVGNEAVDQLRRFNQALEEFSPPQVREPRLIDGIILSKFDTIDDKVGAAISMVYTTGQPIVFVGTGQKYSDLKRMNVPTVIRALLS